MSKPRIAVVGAAGVVGTAMRKLCGPETVAYDLKPGYPYRAMLAICSDPDETADAHVCFEIMRFLNTMRSTAIRSWRSYRRRHRKAT